MEKDLIVFLTEKSALFSKRQRAVADYICEYPDKAAFMTAEMLASSAGVSESTVVRFALELGFDGYPDMRKSIQSVLRSRLNTAVAESEDRLIGCGELLKKAVGESSRGLTGIYKEENTAEYIRTIDMLVKSRRIFILGAGNASAVAHFLYRNINLLRDGAVLLQENVYESLIYAEKSDVVLDVRFSDGYSDSVGALKYARDKGTAVICIAEDSTSPCIRYADACILCSGTDGAAMSPLVSAGCIAEAIIEALCLKTGLELKAAVQNIENIRQEYETR